MMKLTIHFYLVRKWLILDAFQDTMSNAEEVGGDGAITQLPSDGSEFRNPLRRSGSTSSMPNYRLPTPGGALPAGRLPPINREGAMDEPGIQIAQDFTSYSVHFACR